jgi:hypothetical protein
MGLATVRPSGIFFEPTTIHHDEKARLLCPVGCGFIHNPFLHPNGFGATRNRLVNDRKDLFRLPEDIHQIDGAWHSGE